MKFIVFGVIHIKIFLRNYFLGLLSIKIKNVDIFIKKINQFLFLIFCTYYLLEKLSKINKFAIQNPPSVYIQLYF